MTISRRSIEPYYVIIRDDDARLRRHDTYQIALDEARRLARPSRSRISAYRQSLPHIPKPRETSDES